VDEGALLADGEAARYGPHRAGELDEEGAHEEDARDVDSVEVGLLVVGWVWYGCVGLVRTRVGWGRVVGSMLRSGSVIIVITLWLK